MTDQNQLPAWFPMALRIGAVVVAVTLAFAALQGNVNAIDHRVNTLEEDDTKDDEEIKKIREIQIQIVTILERVEQKIDDIDTDLNEHKRERN